MSKSNLTKISVIIPTRSRDLEVLPGAINSVAWVDDVLIADSSVDDTGRQRVKKFAEENGARYIYREYHYSADFKNWAIPQARHDWILLLDSDEIVTDKLKKYIQKLFQKKEINEYDGYGIARKHFFFGKFLRWGGRYPLYNIRLFKKKCRYEDRNVHAHIILAKGKIKNINPEHGDILHFSDRNYEQFFERFARYSDYQAKYIQKMSQQRRNIRWKQFFGNFIYFKAAIKDIWFFIPGHSLWRFVWMYFIKLGFLDGLAGLQIATLYALQDYVAQNKFYAQQGKLTWWRIYWQEKMIQGISTLFSDKETFLDAYEKYFPKIALKTQPIKKTV